tara:strand:- start:1298 stop:1582 length:285 start_codon:yes stop_codon:yes gene_type:complete
MKVREIIERLGVKIPTGQAVAYIKDALDEINTIAETHIETVRIDIDKNQRFYKLPQQAVKVLDIRCKNHDNSDDEYRSIPRLIHEPQIKDADGN